MQEGVNVPIDSLSDYWVRHLAEIAHDKKNQLPESAKKSLLKTISALGNYHVEIRRMTDGFMLVNQFGYVRYLSLGESIVWRLFGRPPKGTVLARAKKARS